MVKNTNLFLPEAFIGSSDAVTTAKAAFVALFTPKNCQWGTNFQRSPVLWIVL